LEKNHREEGKGNGHLVHKQEKKKKKKGVYAGKEKVRGSIFFFSLEREKRRNISHFREEMGRRYGKKRAARCLNGPLKEKGPIL